MDIFYKQDSRLEYIYNNLINEKYLYIKETILYQQLLILLNIEFITYELSYPDNKILLKLVKENTQCIVENIEYLGETHDYVYDIETDVSTFQAGLGNIIVHNTDSIFIINETKLQNNAKKKEKIEEAMKIGITIANEITKQINRSEMILEFEKTLFPLILFSKKRYVSNKYDESSTEFTRNSMGIVTKRRDNAPIVKELYNGVLDLILSDEDISKNLLEKYVINRVETFLNNIVNNKFLIDNFIITKTLKKKYKNPDGIAHKVLADRMKRRDPGSAPQINDRVPFVYISINDKVIKELKYTNIVKLIEYNLKLMTDSNQEILLNKMLLNNDIKKNKFKSIIEIYYIGILGEKLFEELKNEIPLTKELIRRKLYNKIKKNIKITQGDRVEHPDYINEHKLRIDYSIYIKNQLEKPVCQLTNLITPKCSEIFKKYLRKEFNIKNGNKEIDDWFN